MHRKYQGCRLYVEPVIGYVLLHISGSNCPNQKCSPVIFFPVFIFIKTTRYLDFWALLQKSKSALDIEKFWGRVLGQLAVVHVLPSSFLLPSISSHLASCFYLPDGGIVDCFRSHRMREAQIVHRWSVLSEPGREYHSKTTMWEGQMEWWNNPEESVSQCPLPPRWRQGTEA